MFNRNRLISPVVYDSLPIFLDRDDRGPGGRNRRADDDDEELEDPPAPIDAGNASANAIVNSYYQQSQTWLRAERRKVAGYRTRAREAEEALEAAEADLAKKVVLEGDDLALWNDYKAMGKPTEIRKKIDDGEAAVARTAELERDAVIKEAAEVSGYKFPVLKDRVGQDSALTLEVKDVEEDGSKVRKAFVKKDGKDLALDDYATKEWADYMPSLVASGQGNGTGQGNTYGNGQGFPAQRPLAAPRVPTGQAAAASYVGNLYARPPVTGQQR